MSETRISNTAHERRDVIGRYSPNIRWGKQVVELILKCWAYEKSFYVAVESNSVGFDVIEVAIGQLCDSLVDYQTGESIELLDRDGNGLICENEGEQSENWLRAMIVSARIVSWTPPTVNEVRAKNGAGPLLDGDRPWEAV